MLNMDFKPVSQIPCRYCTRLFASLANARSHEVHVHAQERLVKLEVSIVALGELMRLGFEVQTGVSKSLRKEIEELATSQRAAVVDLRAKLMQVLDLIVVKERIES
jgi:hypothetical protein